MIAIILPSRPHRPQHLWHTFRQRETRRIFLEKIVRSIVGICILIAATSANADAVAQIERLEQERYYQLINSNWVGFGSLLAEEFFYNEANGKSVSKNEYIEALRSGALKVQPVIRQEWTIRQYGDVVIVTGITDVDGRSIGDTILQYRYLHVWHQRDNEWKLVARQATYVTPTK